MSKLISSSIRCDRKRCTPPPTTTRYALEMIRQRVSCNPHDLPKFHQTNSSADSFTTSDMILHILRSTDSNVDVEMSDFFDTHNYPSMESQIGSSDLMEEDTDEAPEICRPVTQSFDSSNSDDDSFPTPSAEHVGGSQMVGKFDVLYGRSSGTYLHEGNLHFLKLVQESQEKYKLAPKEYKTRISWDIVERITQLGGRFLKDGSKIEPQEGGPSPSRVWSNEPQKSSR